MPLESNLVGLETLTPSSWEKPIEKGCNALARTANAVEHILFVLVPLFIAGYSGVLAPLTPVMRQLLPIRVQAAISLKTLGTTVKLSLSIFFACKLIENRLSNYVGNAIQREQNIDLFIQHHLTGNATDDADLAGLAIHRKHAGLFWFQDNEVYLKQILQKHLDNKEPNKALAMYLAFFLKYDDYTLHRDTEQTQHLVTKILACCAVLNYTGSGSIDIALDTITMLRSANNRKPHLEALERVCREKGWEDRADLTKSLYENWPRSFDFTLMQEQRLAACIYLEQKDPSARKQQIRIARDLLMLEKGHIASTCQAYAGQVEPTEEARQWEASSGYYWWLHSYCAKLNCLNAAGRAEFKRQASGIASTTIRALNFRACCKPEYWAQAHQE